MEILNFKRLEGFADKNRHTYQNAKPFSNIVIDNFFDEEVFDYVYNCFPRADNKLWKTPTNKHTREKSVVKRGITGLKENSLPIESKE